MQRKIPVLAVWLRDLVISLAISAFIIIFLYQPVKVEGTSMMPSLDDQERIFVNKFVYRWEPIERGDI
ncbi:MAG TPA: signal peptidase I, partial [Terriglobales bacterium]|nr:signal peptidase I [Terriglobales bacterium]